MSDPTPGTGEDLCQVFESLPISAFDRFPNKGPKKFLRAMFGNNTTVEPIIYCERSGSWVTGWTVIVTFPTGAVSSFVLARPGVLELRWKNESRWNRMKSLHLSLRTVQWYPDMLNLITTQAAWLEQYATDCYFDFDQHGVINDEFAPWVLRHALAAADTDHEAVRFLLAMTLAGSAQELTHRLIETATNISANHAHDKHGDSAEAAVVAAVRRYNGVTLHGAQVESTGIAGALMGYPREQWPHEADRLVAHMYATRTDLSPGFHPEPHPPLDPDPVPPGPRSGSHRFAIAA